MMAKEMLEGGSRSISTSEEVTQEAQTDMAWLHYLRFRVAVANGAQVLEQTEMLREAAALPGMDSA